MFQMVLTSVVLDSYSVFLLPMPKHLMEFWHSQVTEVYSAGSNSPIKRKKWRHNMSCCLAALISDFPSAANCTTSNATTIFLARIAKGEEDSAEEVALLTCLGGDEDVSVSYDDDPRGVNIDSSTMMRTQQQQEKHVQQDFANATTTTGAPAPQHCHTPPPAKDANAFAKKQGREIKERNDAIQT